jgi:hypothetical protein
MPFEGRTLMFKKKIEPEMTKLEKRVSRIATPDLSAWGEQAMFEIGRSLASWQRGGEKYYLDEATQGAEALYAVFKELQRRTNV